MDIVSTGSGSPPGAGSAMSYDGEASVSERDDEDEASSPDYFHHGSTDVEVNAGQALFAALCRTRATAASSQDPDTKTPTRKKSVEGLLQEAMMALSCQDSASSQ